MPLWYFRSNTEKEKNLSCGSGVWKYHLKLRMFSPSSGLSVASPGIVKGSLTCYFITLVLGIVNMWFRHARPWPGENRNNFPWCFLHKSILHQSCFPSLFFFLWTFRKILYQFLYPIVFCIKCKKKTLEIEKGRQEHWRRTLPFFPLHCFFYVRLRRFSIIFFSIPLVFVQG